MSKMSELDAVIRDLRTAAAAINDAADTLSEMFSGETAEAPAKPTEPVPTKEDVRAILAEMSSSWCGNAIRHRPYGVRRSDQGCGGTRKWVITLCYPRPHPTGG